MRRKLGQKKARNGAFWTEFGELRDNIEMKHSRGFDKSSQPVMKRKHEEITRQNLYQLIVSKPFSCLYDFDFFV